MDEFIIKSSLDDCSLKFCNRNPEDRSASIDYYDVEIARCDLFAKATVYAGYTAAHPALWLHELAQNWKGLRDEFIWKSLEGELSLAGSRDRFGHITIRAELRPSFGRNWE